MARPDAAEDSYDRSVLGHNMQYNKVVSRLLKPDLERHFPDRAHPPADTRMIRSPRGSLTRANEQEDLIRSQGLPQDDLRDSGESLKATKRTMSLRSPSKNSRESVRVSTNLGFWDLNFS